MTLPPDITELDGGLRPDIKELEVGLNRDIKELEISFKQNIAELKRDMKDLEYRRTIKLGAMLMVAVGSMAALVKIP